MEYLGKDKIVWKTENFVVVAPTSPYISREEGGHLILKPYPDQFKFDSRLDLNQNELLEMQRLCQIVCKAFVKAMKKQNIDIVRMNFFEAGNWAWKKDINGNIGKPFYHEHIFGRTMNAKYQKFPDAPYLPDRKTGFYDNFKTLTEEDVYYIIDEIKVLDNSEEYKKFKWKI